MSTAKKPEIVAVDDADLSLVEADDDMEPAGARELGVPLPGAATSPKSVQFAGMSTEKDGDSVRPVETLSESTLSGSPLAKSASVLSALDNRGSRGTKAAEAEHNSPLWDVWQALDHDSSGYLSFSEFSQVSAKLGVQWNTKKAWEDARLVTENDWRMGAAKKARGIATQPIPSDRNVVNFHSFNVSYNATMSVERIHTRLAVKGLFEKLQTDPGGLNYGQMLTLVKRSTKSLFLLAPGFQGREDWDLMLALSGEKEVKELVSFIEFERWWKHRMGLTEAETPVIPEFFSFALSSLLPVEEINKIETLKRSRSVSTLLDGDKNTLKERNKRQRSKSMIRLGVPDETNENDQEGLGRELYSGKEAWDLLRPRLGLLLTARRDWGSINDVYGHCESFYGHEPMAWYIRDPEAPLSQAWDAAQVVLLLYVSFTIPAYTCFGIEVQFLTLRWYIDFFVDLFFVVDIVFNFFTAFERFTGVVEVRLPEIAMNYVRGWFFIDLLSCTPVQYVQLLIASREAGQATDPGSVRALKAVRLVRLTKMLRLARLKRILERYENLAIMEYMGLVSLLFVIMLMTHVLACIWYYIGHGTYVINGFVRNGWVLDEWAVIDEISFFEKYFTSIYFCMHVSGWAVQQAVPVERYFAILNYLCIILIEGAVAGVLSATLIGLSGKEHETSNQIKTARLWMYHQRIPKAKARGALDYFRSMYKSKVVMEEDKILSLMPPAMKTEFSYFIYAKYVSQVPLFRGLPTGVIQPLCNACNPMMVVKHQVIIEEGSTGTEMYILINGECEISTKNERLGFLADGAFFGEVPILDNSTGAAIRSRTVTAMTDCQLAFLRRKDIGKLRNEFPELGLRLVRCARVRKNQTVNRKSKQFKATMEESAVFRSKYNIKPSQAVDEFKTVSKVITVGDRATHPTPPTAGKAKAPFGGTARDRLTRAVKQTVESTRDDFAVASGNRAYEALGKKVQYLSDEMASNARETAVIKKRLDGMAGSLDKIAKWVDSQPT